MQVDTVVVFAKRLGREGGVGRFGISALPYLRHIRIWSRRSNVDVCITSVKTAIFAFDGLVVRVQLSVSWSVEAPGIFLLPGLCGSVRLL